MLERYLIDHCSPTLASLKTANMFSCPYESGESLEEDVRKWNLQMKDKGLCLTILRKNDKKALVYLCRPQRLEQDLHKPGVQKSLRACGYRGEHWEEALTELKDRLHMCEKFPHEIGLFLDYPLVDVIGFIRNTGKNCKCSGCWKAYGNAKEAEKTFCRYKKCREIYSRLWENGRSVLQLTVAA